MKSQCLQRLFSLNGKRIVLTGAAGFFGAHFTEALLAYGAEHLYLLDRDAGRLRSLVMQNDNHRVSAVTIDQYDRATTTRLFKRLAHRGVDVLVNCSFDFSRATGFRSKVGKVATARYKHLLRSFDAALYWPFHATQVLGVAARKSGRPLTVVNIGSMYSHVVPSPDLYEGVDYFNPPGYSMAKTGLVGMTKYLAAWLAPEVRVNMLCPGAIPNNERKSQNSEQNKDKKFTDRLTSRTVLKRLGHPRDLVGPLVFLASDASAYMTGQSVIVDGGWTIT